MTHKDEINNGWVVRYVTDATLDDLWQGGTICEQAYYRTGSEHHPHKIEMILPPKPLEIEGYVCDAKERKNKNCVARHNELDAADCCILAGLALMKELNCRPIVLIEKP